MMAPTAVLPGPHIPPRALLAILFPSPLTTTTPITTTSSHLMLVSLTAFKSKDMEYTRTVHLKSHCRALNPRSAARSPFSSQSSKRTSKRLSADDTRSNNMGVDNNRDDLWFSVYKLSEGFRKWRLCSLPVMPLNLFNTPPLDSFSLSSPA